MICHPCRSTRHKMCDGKSWCDCQHRGEDAAEVKGGSDLDRLEQWRQAPRLTFPGQEHVGLGFAGQVLVREAEASCRLDGETQSLDEADPALGRASARQPSHKQGKGQPLEGLPHHLP